MLTVKTQATMETGEAEAEVTATIPADRDRQRLRRMPVQEEDVPETVETGETLQAQREVRQDQTAIPEIRLLLREMGETEEAEAISPGRPEATTAAAAEPVSARTETARREPADTF